MKSSDVIDPAVLEMPFAVNGDKNNIPATNTPSSGYASQSLGFPPITQEEPEDGGIPPDRKDFNGLGYITTSHSFYSQTGSLYTFSESVSAAIGGYPSGAKLWYTDAENKVRLLVSLKDDNTDNFITTPSVIGPDGSWNDVIASEEFVTKNFINNNRVSNTVISAPNGVVSYSGLTLTVPEGLEVAIPNGRDEKNNKISTYYTVPSAITKELSLQANTTKFLIFLDSTGNVELINALSISFYHEINPQYINETGCVFVDDQNKWMKSTNSGSSYEAVYMCPIGEIWIGASSVGRIWPYYPFSLATSQDLMTVAQNSPALNFSLAVQFAVKTNFTLPTNGVIMHTMGTTYSAIYGVYITYAGSNGVIDWHLNTDNEYDLRKTFIFSLHKGDTVNFYDDEHPTGYTYFIPYRSIA